MTREKSPECGGLGLVSQIHSFVYPPNYPSHSSFLLICKICIKCQRYGSTAGYWTAEKNEAELCSWSRWGDEGMSGKLTLTDQWLGQVGKGF